MVYLKTNTDMETPTRIKLKKSQVVFELAHLDVNVILHNIIDKPMATNITTGSFLPVASHYCKVNYVSGTTWCSGKGFWVTVGTTNPGS